MAVGNSPCWPTSIVSRSLTPGGPSRARLFLFGMQYWRMRHCSSPGRYRTRLWLAIGLGLAATAMAARADHQTPVIAVSISNLQSLAFGKFAAGSGGTVTVSPAGARTATAGVVLLSSDGGAAASFRVSGDAGLSYDIVLPPDGAVVLDNGAGQSMAVDGFTSSPADFGQLDLSGVQTVSVGATLTVATGQAAGNYSGSFNVTVDYN